MFQLNRSRLCFRVKAAIRCWRGTMTDSRRTTVEAYPGISPFEDTERDRLLFFGRTAETRALLHMVLSESLVVVFGRSGLGKTSLINAALKNELRGYGYFPVVARVSLTRGDAVAIHEEREMRPLESAIHQLNADLLSLAKRVFSYSRSRLFREKGETLREPKPPKPGESSEIRIEGSNVKSSLRTVIRLLVTEAPAIAKGAFFRLRSQVAFGIRHLVKDASAFAERALCRLRGFVRQKAKIVGETDASGEPTELRPLTSGENAMFASVIDSVKVEASHRKIDIETRTNTNGIWEFFSETHFFAGEAEVKPVLILDQFEELFTLARDGDDHSRKRTLEFIQDLACLVSRVLPRRKRQLLRETVENLELGSDSRRESLDLLYGISAPEVRVVIVIREDYLPELDSLKNQGLPQLFHASFRLLPLNRQQAREAIEHPRSE